MEKGWKLFKMFLTVLTNTCREEKGGIEVFMGNRFGPLDG